MPSFRPSTTGTTALVNEQFDFGSWLELPLDSEVWLGLAFAFAFAFGEVEEASSLHAVKTKPAKQMIKRDNFIFRMMPRSPRGNQCV
jgi:hypothetical protein